MKHDEGKRVSIGLRQLGDGLEQLGHGVRHVGVGGGRGEDRPHAGRDHRLPQPTEEVLHDPSQRVDVVLRQIGAAFTHQELLSQVLDLPLTAGHPVDADLSQPAPVDLVNAVDDDGGDHGGGGGDMVRQLTSPAQGGLGGSLGDGARGDAGDGDLVTTFRMANCSALTTHEADFAEFYPFTANTTGFSIVFILLDKLMLPVDARVAV